MSCFEDLGLAIVFDFYTGLRIGELCGLKWGDFDFEKRSFKVQRTLQRVQKKKENIQPDSSRTEIVNGELKTKNSYREIPIPNAIFDELLNLKKQQEKEKELYGELYQDMGYVFSNKCGGFVEPSYLRSVYNRILKKSGIRHLNFHTIRHTFATRAIEAGAPAKVVSEILGHSSIQTTMDLYCHPSLDAKRDVIENRSLL